MAITDPRIAFAIATLILASPGHEVEALKTLIDKDPNDKQAKRMAEAGLSLEEVREAARIALDEWEKPDAC